jgi:hypothetical protein
MAMVMMYFIFPSNLIVYLVHSREARLAALAQPALRRSQSGSVV